VAERATFDLLSQLGRKLVDAHLMRQVPDLGLGSYQGGGDDMVRDVRYVQAEEAVYINDSQRFAPVPPETWAFHIGGYQVLLTYLKYRKGRTHRFGPRKDQDWPLMLDEIENVEKVVNILGFTIEQMKAIDEAYKAAFHA
jgi:Type ISP C-terminal specificity domain